MLKTKSFFHALLFLSETLDIGKNGTFCWFSNLFGNIFAKVRPALKNLIAGLPGSVEKLPRCWKLNDFFWCATFIFWNTRYWEKWDLLLFFEFFCHYMCIIRTSSKKFDCRTSRICWKITEMLKTVIFFHAFSRTNMTKKMNLALL